MSPLAKCLANYIESHFDACIKQSDINPVRPILVGPQAETLLEVFDYLTKNGKEAWKTIVNGSIYEVAVLFVRARATAGGSPQVDLATICQWDYAVTIRNSCPRILILADPSIWDKRPESLTNTTETLGSARTQLNNTDSSLWTYIIQAISTSRGVLEESVRDVVCEIFAQAAKLEPSSRDKHIWGFINLLLEPAQTVFTPIDALCYSGGIPAAGSLTIQDSINVIDKLAEYLLEKGFSEGFQELKQTQTAKQQHLEQSLDALKSWITNQAPSPVAFRTAPSSIFKPSTPPPKWFLQLNAAVLGSMLKELKPEQGKLSLTCENAVILAKQVPGLPCIALSSPVLKASASRSVSVGNVSFTRRIGRNATEALLADATDSNKCTDINPPSHNNVIKYFVDASDSLTGTIDVIVLDSFSAQGLAHVRDAIWCSIPVLRPGSAIWSQEVTLPRGGVTELNILHSSKTAAIQLSLSDGTIMSGKVAAGSVSTSFQVDVEDGDTIGIQMIAAGGAVLANLSVLITVEENNEVAKSRFKALLNEHRTGKKHIPQPPDSLVQRLESNSYVPEPESWKPVFACWSGKIEGTKTINWNDPKLGDVLPVIDPRPSHIISPPQSFLTAREAVRSYLFNLRITIAEIHLDESDLQPLLQNYLKEYILWLESDPNDACWSDVIVLHTADFNQQAAAYVPSEEPIMLLLSPLHPLRLSWHATSQKQLQESIGHYCPISGLLDPSSCPDVGVLFLWNGQQAKPRSFFSIPCENPHWAVLQNTKYLDRKEERDLAIQCINALGLSVHGITGGFTSAQTIDSLQEVNRLLPARSILRVGIVGDPETSHSCDHGVIIWAQNRFTDKDAYFGCTSLEIYDTRKAETPSPEQLASLSESTNENAKWYRKSQDNDLVRLDLTIIDQLGARALSACDGITRSPLAPSALFRVRIREDYAAASTLNTSRIAINAINKSDIGTTLSKTLVTYEGLSLHDDNKSHFSFRPNQEAIEKRLSSSTFLSITSSQIDPACIVRGASNRGGYLWDYELPDILSGSESNLGYYIVASPTEAMEHAISESVSLATTAAVNPRHLLDEISRHGIPVLKKLAGGGSQSKGELGLLLATRLLQDAFRDGAASPRLPVWEGRCIHMILPVDPYQELFEKIRGRLASASKSDKRPDLLVVAIDLGTGSEPVSIKITPVEVKFRRPDPMSPSDLAEALKQAQNLGELLSVIWTNTLPTGLWETCSFALLAHFLDFGFRIYGSSKSHNHSPVEWANNHQRVIQEVLDRSARISVNAAGRLLVFDGYTTSTIADLDNDGRYDTAVISPSDTDALLAGIGALSPSANSATHLLDFSFPQCSCASSRNQSAADVLASEAVKQTYPGINYEIAVPQQTIKITAAPESEINPDTFSELEPSPQITTSSDTTTSPDSTTISPITQEQRQMVKRAFDGFIGNESAVSRLTNDILRALIDKPTHLPKNYLFTGLPSTGKTELARRMAVALELPFVKIDGRGVTSRDRLFELVNGELQSQGRPPSQVDQRLGLPVLEYPPLIVFIDEVHLVTRQQQESVLTMLEKDDRTVVLADHVARVTKATFLFATTRASDLDPAFLSRCDEIQLREYTEEQVAQILRRKFKYEWPEQIYLLIARLGRCVPRVAIELTRSLETALIVAEGDGDVADHLDKVRSDRELDKCGLTRMDLEYLDLLERTGRPLGFKTIENQLRTVDKERILNDVEPFLSRLGLIRHGAQGREITQNGIDYLMAKRLGR